ncbi:hypothetical protein AB0I82_35240 [Streptomyces sp. NPDC050315]|uniref:hypothetical protein n=1 Tax=Streptomyces sp. NPDC050315 TaxID=3155039 RepID=UPI0034462753
MGTEHQVTEVHKAFVARDAVLRGDETVVDQFASRVLTLPTGPRWREAISTALLGTWERGTLRRSLCAFGSVAAVREEARLIHRQLTPLWRRRTRHGRVLLLDMPIGDDGMTLYDLAVGSSAVDDLVHGVLPENPRVAAVLAQLRPEEQVVALALAHRLASGWTEAAALTGAADPVALGERVRRKLQRRGAQYTDRAAAAAATRRAADPDQANSS